MSKTVALFCLSTVMSASIALAAPTLISSRVKYRDTGHKAATGRSGSASIQARALLGADGGTTVEVTTGSFDSDTPAPGNISKLQLKILGANGPVGLDNYKFPSGGTVTLQRAGLNRGERFQVQANVNGIDPNRNDVVTVSDSVALRPDLAVTGIHAPARTAPSVPVVLAADLRELNGDAGARGDCVLRVDGVEVSRASALWVDAGSAVTCTFNYAFASTGTKQVSIALSNVVPGDWDPSNNERHTTVEVVNPVDVFHAAQVDSSSFRSHSVDQGWYTSASSGAAPDYYSESNSSGTVDYAYFYGSMPAAVTLPAQTAKMKMTSNGASLETDFSPLVPSATSWGTTSNGGTCEWRLADFITLNSCTVRGPAGAFTWLQIFRFGGEVTYHNDGFCGYDANGECRGSSVYEWNYDYTVTRQPRLALQGSVRFDVELGGWSSSYRATQNVALTPYAAATFESDCTSRPSWWNYGSGSYCHSLEQHVTGVSGSASGTN